MGGIATIGGSGRRVVGVSGVYGCKTPRVVAQSAVHLGEIWVTWGVWGVVDDGLGVVASPCGVAGSARAVLGVFQWVLDANGDVIYHNDELIVTDSHTFTIRSHIE